MTAPPQTATTERRPLGATGLQLPPIVFGTSSLGNMYRAYSEQTKRAVLAELVRSSATPLVLDSAGKYGAGLALEVIGDGLRALGVPPSDVLINNKLGWARVPLRGPEPTFEPGVWAELSHDAEQDISYEGILRCWEQGNDLLGPPYAAGLVSVHDPDEYLARATGARARERAKQDVLAAYRALHELKRAGKVQAVGVGAKDWRVIAELVQEVELDWIMLACSLTVFHHPPELLALIEELSSRRLGIINSAVFHAGFLTGGKFFDYRVPDPMAPEDRPLFAWRERFTALCRERGVAPAAACVRFALSPPGVTAVALSTSRPEQVAGNVSLAQTDIPSSFWKAAKASGIVHHDYPYVG